MGNIYENQIAGGEEIDKQTERSHNLASAFSEKCKF